jgi:hypothetical protein
VEAVSKIRQALLAAQWIVIPITAVIGLPPVLAAICGVHIVKWMWVWNGIVWLAVSAALYASGKVLERADRAAETGGASDAPKSREGG